ncbi:MAG: DUF3604 domain-containing protein [Deltaproteobacteria bacterium]|nr:DUF3604 domain-containing protein [Deltaproteobacteria bacterium]
MSGTRLLVGFFALILGLVGIALGLVYAAGHGAFGSHEGPGEIVGTYREPEAVAAAAARVAAAADDVGVPRPKQVLFGDFHVHTTYSYDAFLFSLPGLIGEGAHPPADACDFARHCSALDFFSINDHAEGLSPLHWKETVDSIRQCAAVASDPANPDLVPFLGWEWTQQGTTPENHYGHKNVVLAGLSDEEIPARPIASAPPPEGPPLLARGLLALRYRHPRIHDLAVDITERAAIPVCAEGVATRELPADCTEVAPTPADLFAKLDEWGVPSIVIPHGTTWGIYTPPGTTWDKQLEGASHDPERQSLLEIYSGHGDSDVYRKFRAVEFDENGEAVCPAPSDEYLPTCWRAGEIIRERCLSEGLVASECEERAATARIHAAQAGSSAHLVVPGAIGSDWLDSGQCRDCDQPAFNYRPGGSAQYLLSLGNFDEDEDKPRRFRFGFIGSSDNHTGRAGSGYKEVERPGMTDSMAPPFGPLARLLRPAPEEPAAASRPFDVETSQLASFQRSETERLMSFFQTGGLVALHAEGRDRAAIWEAVQRKEVYGTSGPRILLWFDLLNPPGSAGRTAPMGSEVAMQANPIFQVRAVGSFEQQEGCPEASARALGPDRLARLCKNECYHPGDVRRPITRIEIVRVRPQQDPAEDPSELIEDPWRTFECELDGAGCSVTFEDDSFGRAGRESVYYARAYEAPALAINAGGVRCTYDDDGNCISVNLCSAQPASDDCLAEHEPRAWSSPIFLDYTGKPPENPEEAALARLSPLPR